MSSTNPKNLLSIAGSDPSGGAGIQADLKTFSALGAYGMSVITSLTAQNTQGVQKVAYVDAQMVSAQIKSVFDDIEVHGVKIGMIGSLETAGEIISALKTYEPQNVVLDPVMVATSGDQLVSKEVIHMIKQDLFPLCDLITPNIPEHNVLAKSYPDYFDLGVKHVLVKGGHNAGQKSTDILVDESGITEFEAPWIDTKNTHGTGCSLSSAITVFLAQGCDLEEAIDKAKAFVTEAISHADDLNVGEGHGPIHHFHCAWQS